MDFTITNDGDLNIEKYHNGTITENHISTSTGDKLRNQIAMCRIISITHDWYYDNIGANLEQLIGSPLSSSTIKHGRELIMSSLTKNEFISSDEITVEDVLTSSNSIGYNVFIKQMEVDSTFVLIEVSLDLIKGVKVLLKGDVHVNIK